MKTPHEPLTPEERELAAQLSRLGPHGGPSPQLDARILSAARTAVQGRTVSPVRRPRWPLGLGVAASVLLAVGVAWQLRPLEEVPVASEVPAGAMSAPAPADAAAAMDVEPAAAEEESRLFEAPLVGPAPPPPIPQKALADPARQNAEAAARKEEAPRRSPLSVIPSVPGLPLPAETPAPAPQRSAPQAFPKTARAQEGLGAGAAVPPAQPAPAATTEAREEAALRFRAESREQSKRAAEARDAESRTLDQVIVSGGRVRATETDTYGFTAPAPAAPPPPPAPAASAGSSAEPGAARTALRRTDLQVPVDEDTKLPAEEWLDRIRLRRDLGDAANATRSLQLFVQEHPFQRIPDDLRPLLGEP